MISLVLRVTRYELRLWKSLLAWVARRPRFGTRHNGAQAYSYVRAAAPLIWVFIVVSAIEVVVVELLLPWETIRSIALVLGIWGVLWMVGLFASFVMHPHVVDDDGIRVRHSLSVDVTIPRDAIANIRHQLVNLPNSKTLHINTDGGDTAVKLGVSSQTNVRVDLVEPLALPFSRGTEMVNALHFYADDSRALVAEVLRRRDEATAEGVTIDGRTQAGDRRR